MGKRNTKTATAKPGPCGENADQGADGRFLPGNRANPGGRPKALRELKDRVQREGLELVEALFAIVRGEPLREQRGRRVRLVYPSHADRYHACKELLDRGYGRTVQAVEMTGRGGGPLESRDISDMTSSERRAYLKELMAKAGAVFLPRAEEDNETDEDGEDKPDA